MHAGAVALERNEMRRRPFLARDVHDQIGPLRRGEHDSIGRHRCIEGLAVERHDPALHPLQSEREGARVRGVDEPQPQPLVALGREPEIPACVDRDPVSDASGMRPVHHCAEALLDARVVGETPVVDDQHFVPIDGRRSRLLDDDRAVQTARHLLPRAVVRVVPVRARVRHDEVIEELAARGNGRLGEFGHPVHRVDDADPVPVDRGRLRQIVEEEAGKGLPLRHAEHGARHLPAIGPDRRLGIAGWRKVCRARGRAQRRRSRRRKPGARRPCQHNPRDTGEKLSARYVHATFPTSVVEQSAVARHCMGGPPATILRKTVGHE